MSNRNQLRSFKLFRFKSLTAKLLAMIVLLMAVCAVSFTLVSYYEVQRSMTSQMKSDGTTLVTNIKREIAGNEISGLEGLQQIFQAIQTDSAGNIVYVSLSDASGQLIVSNDSRVEQGTGEQTDASASASATSTEADLSAVITGQEIQGSILETAGGEKVYNISTDFAYSEELSGALNVGISLESMYAEIREALLETVIISLIILIFAIGLGLLMARKMVRPLFMMSARIKDYSTGDFSTEFVHDSHDEIGKIAKDLAHMRTTLGGIVENIQVSAGQVSSGSGQLATMIEESAAAAREISSATDALAAGSGDLATNSQEGLERLNRLAAEIHVLTERADQMKARMEETLEANKISMSSMKELQQAIRDNADVTLGIEGQVNDLSAKSEAITEVTTVIKGIAEQTNLLALNAMIESARAGEQGRGFAVVAEQIRKLADQTTGSVHGIEEMVHEVAEAVAKTRDLMLQGAEVISRTSEVSRETGHAFKKIDLTVHQMIEEIEGVTEGITQVDGNKNEVVGTIENISAIAEESTAATQEISASTEQQLAGMTQVTHSAAGMKAVADDLNRLVGQFKF
ncbi:methyl-accepting chemotaxis protein [Paenibacillus senegalimassiliensis]|uniref:methyl-accepting chemotaxis protein n=1 Tax=Paenibacillus senegalimassiliensis TaxID=1737426 RepID=UPI00073EE9F9|nr:methyl-accepting chemotaxis protein [Paenibacillus senegalimassiliensis]